ncbi:MAG: nitroreductase family protein [Candidatus Omnitrophota bacterium]|jgi:nitroreductase
MDTLTLIKNRCSIRRYKKKAISKKKLKKIIEAGVWGPSVPSFLMIQPWKFVVVLNARIKKKIVNAILRKSRISGTGVNIMLSSASRIIDAAPVVILVYNSNELADLKFKFKEIFLRFAKIIPRAELSAISAAIQNMILVAEDLGIGSCWLDIPLFCSKEINKIINENKKLMAVLTLGYSSEKGKRAHRKPLIEMVRVV